ncbi:hypothetical protein [Lapillicoccus jejuensis]|uniref:M6 family metalloprotease-like protein n=1 Tax=Lapillicoccus jejuensis TaxID=402171 RepID=A0A542DVU7_9MICO|nr:hypothetical protein [Lapillicoccus jejuensis]TQJ07176.1 M6 family metalloprotease-like protein [Lapillicoccus jejuensis]
MGRLELSLRPGGHRPRSTTGTPYGAPRPSGRRPRLIGLAAVAAVLGGLLGGVALPASATPTGFVPLASASRLLDTRTGAMPAFGQVLTLPVLGRAGLPTSGVGAVSLNVTSVGSTTSGYVSVFPCGRPAPVSSTVNYAPGQTVANAALVGVGNGGAVCLLVQGRSHVVVDVSGWFPTGGASPLPSPVRLVDTRPGRPAVDTDVTGRGPMVWGSELAVPVAGRGGVPTSATAVVLNITAVGARTSGFLSVYPCGAKPTTPASTINYLPGTTRANAAVTGLGTSGAGAGKVCVYSPGVTDVVVDVAATLPSTTFVPLPGPARLLDTRARATADGRMSGVGPEPAGATLTLPVAGRVGLGAATAVVLNVTAVAPVASGYTTVYPQGPTAPRTSNLNYGPGQVVSNMVVAPLAPDGSVCLTTAGVSTDLVVDVAGSLTAPRPSGLTAPCPSLAVNTSPDAVRGALVYRAPMQRVVGSDSIGIVKCHVPDNYPGYDASWTAIPGASTDVSALAGWANNTVARYYANVSGNAYRPTFYNALQTVTLTASASSTGPGDCLDKALASTGLSAYTNVMVVDDRLTPFGFGGPGYLPTTSSPNQDVLHQGPPSTSGRGFFVGGLPAFYGQSPTPATDQRNIALVAHELGHTLHWPHSYHSATGGGPADEYDSPVDLMSGTAGGPDNGWCDDGKGFQYACKPQSALAFDRLAAGWMTSRQSVVHSGVTTYTLDVANNDDADTAGTQVVVVRDPRDPWSVLTIEGRAGVTGPNGTDAGPADGLLHGQYCHVVTDPGDPSSSICDPTMLDQAHDGVVVTRVRQSGTAVAGSPSGCYDHSSSNPAYWTDLGYGLCRRQEPASTTPYSFDNVLGAGTHQVVDGVTIDVVARTATTFTVRVQGSYLTPSSMTTKVGAAAGLAAGAAGADDVPVAGRDGGPLRTTPEEVHGTRRLG